jgi:hypothetical protein
MSTVVSMAMLFMRSVCGYVYGCVHGYIAHVNTRF